MEEDSFVRELASAINRHSIDTFCGMPDFLIVEYVLQSLQVLAMTNGKYKAWLGVEWRPGEGLVKIAPAPVDEEG